MSCVSSYLASQLHAVGCEDIFLVPGDSNIPLLNNLYGTIGLIPTCSELGAAYAADGYARSKGFGCCIVTVGVGALSAINGVGGAFAEHVPMMIISGAPHSKHFKPEAGKPSSSATDMPSMFLHHSLGPVDEGCMERHLEIFRHVTADQDRIESAEGAREKIDRLILRALRDRRPVYLEICVDTPALPLEASPSPDLRWLASSADHGVMDGPYKSLVFHLQEPCMVRTAAEHISKAIAGASRPLMLLGSHARPQCLEKTGRIGRRDEMPLTVRLAEALGLPVVVSMDARGAMPESHPLFRGVVWGSSEDLSTGSAGDLMMSSDCILSLGSLFYDMNTLFYSTPTVYPTMIRCHVDGTATFGSKVARILQGAGPCSSPGGSVCEAQAFSMRNVGPLRKLIETILSMMAPAPGGHMNPLSVGSSYASSMMVSPGLTASVPSDSEGGMGDAPCSAVPVLALGLPASATPAANANGTARSLLGMQLRSAGNSGVDATWTPSRTFKDASEKASALAVRPDAMHELNHMFGSPSAAARWLLPSDMSEAVSEFLTEREDLVVETGDTICIGHRVKLPAGSQIFGQYQNTSIGWSMGSALGIAAALRHEGRRAVLLVGEGSFQLTGAELSSMARAGLNPVVIINVNGGYLTEVQVDDKHFSTLPVWDHASFTRSVCTALPKGRCLVHTVRTPAALASALRDARERPEAMVVIEAIVQGHSEDLAVFCRKAVMVSIKST